MQTTPTNAVKVRQLETMLARLLVECLRRDFHGAFQIEVAVQDGTIQHLRRRVEQRVR